MINELDAGPLMDIGGQIKYQQQQNTYTNEDFSPVFFFNAEIRSQILSYPLAWQ